MKYQNQKNQKNQQTLPRSILFFFKKKRMDERKDTNLSNKRTKGNIKQVVWNVSLDL